MWAYAHLPFLQNPRKLLRQRRREGTAGEITQFPGKLRKREDRRVKKLVRQGGTPPLPGHSGRDLRTYGPPESDGR